MNKVSLDVLPSVVPPAPRALHGKERHPVARLPEEWRPYLAEKGEPGFRADQIFRWIHAQGVFDAERMTNLSRTLRAELAQLDLGCPLDEVSARRSTDGTRKLLLRLRDGLAIECVLIPQGKLEEDLEDDEDDASADAGDKPLTLCVSTQVGCANGVFNDLAKFRWFSERYRYLCQETVNDNDRQYDKQSLLHIAAF